MEGKNSVPFPQANDFDKILKILCIENEQLLKDKDYLLNYLEVGSYRQILYYLSACEFLLFIDKNRSFTELGSRIRRASEDIKKVMICKAIISSPVFGEIFFLKYIYGEEVDDTYISSLISSLYGIENIAVCDRRAATVKRWVQWVEQQSSHDVN